MKKTDYLIIFLLAFLAFFIWVRDLSWTTSSEDTLPILVALPLFVWLARPWHFLEKAKPFPSFMVIFASCIFALGIGTNLTILLAIGWTLFLWAWLKTRCSQETHDRIKKLLVLPIVSFPWVTLDASLLGWWFRLSGAIVTAKVYEWMGSNVIQEGTQILINGIPISVEAACAGLNTLQSMLIAGVFIAYVILGDSSKYWFNIALLVFMAWLANTLRIVVIVMAALLVSPTFALGTFHMWGGWFVLVLMFVLCWGIFSIQEEKKHV